jgi:hypothetical protein
MGGVLGMPYFITQYTGHQYDYDNHKPIGVAAERFVIPDAQKSLMTSILSAGTFFGALIVSHSIRRVARLP